MSGIITTGSFSKALWPGIKSWYGKAYDEFPVEYTHLFDTETSRKAFEEDVGTSGLGLFQVKPEGAPIAYDTERQGFVTRYTHIKYGLGFVITKEMFEDDQYDIVGQKRSKALAFSLRQTKEVLGASVYNRAFNPAFVGGDGVSMLNAAHPTVAGGTYSNILAVAADFSEASLEQALIDIMKYTDDRGNRISVMAKSLILPTDLYFEAERILKSPFTPGTANNAINALKSTGKFPDGAKICHYLTDSDAWFIRTNVQDGLKYYERQADDFSEYNDFDTENAKYKATFRCSFGWTDPRAIYGSPGA
jgi:hypothetical protein